MIRILIEYTVGIIDDRLGENWDEKLTEWVDNKNSFIKTVLG